MYFIGHGVDPKHLPKSRTLPNPSARAVVRPEKAEMQGSFIGGSLTSIQNTAGKQLSIPATRLNRIIFLYIDGIIIRSMARFQDDQWFAQ